MIEVGDTVLYHEEFYKVLSVSKRGTLKLRKICKGVKKKERNDETWYNVDPRFVQKASKRVYK